MKKINQLISCMFNPVHADRYVLNNNRPFMCCGDPDNTHPEDDDYNGGGNYDGW